MADDFTARFRVDISDLKKNITEANKQIKLANATFKSEVAGMDKWSASADGLAAKLKQLKGNLESQKTILSSYEEQLKRQKEAQEKNAKVVETLKEKITQLKKAEGDNSKEIENYQRNLKDARAELQRNEKAVEDLELKILDQKTAVTKTEKAISAYISEEKKLDSESKSLSSTVEKQAAKLEDLRRKYIDVASAEGKDSDAAKDLAREIGALSSELKNNKEKLQDAETELQKYDKSVEDSADATEQAAGGGFTVFAGMLANIATEVVNAAIDALKQLVVESIQAGSDFEAAMSKVEAVSGANAGQMAELTDKAKEMGKTTKFSASESAAAFNYMAMAGWKTEDMIDGIEGVMNLAAASGEELATVSDIVTDALTALGYSAKDSGKFADVLAAASSNANTNVSMMGSTFQYAAPLAGALNYSMEDLAVAIGLMANAGIKGDKAGTALRAMFSRLAAPPKEAASVIEELNLSLENADGTMRPMRDVIAELRDKFSDMSEAEQAANAKHLAGMNAMSGFLALVNAAPEDYNKLIEAVDNSAGAAENMAGIMQDNVQGSMTLLKSQIEGIQIDLFEKLSPAFQEAIKAFQDFLAKINWDAIGDAIKNLSDKVLPVLVDTLLPKVFDWLEQIANAAAPIVHALEPLVSDVFDVIVELIDKLAPDLQKIGELVADIISTLRPYLEPVLDFVEEIADILAPTISDTLELTQQLFNLLKPALEFIEPILKRIMDAAKNTIKWFSGIIEFITGVFTLNWEKAWSGIQKVFTAFWDNAIGIVKTPINWIIGAINGIISGINSLSIDIPDWVPFVGGQHWGMNIPKIPELARGGVVKKPTYLQAGERGAEAIVPLERNTQWIRAVANDLLSALSTAAKTTFNSQTNNTDNRREYQFTQIINAPQQPSRYELYCQTQNLLELVKQTGGV